MMIVSDYMPAELRQVLLVKYGLDKPLHIQFIKYIQQLSQGNLGTSFQYQKPVITLILERLPNTILLLLSANLISIPMSIAFGLLAAWKMGSKIDISTTISSLILYSMPIFWLGGLLLMYFAVQLRMFPVIGISTPWLKHENVFSYIKDVAHHLFLPMIAIAISDFGGLFLIMRNSLLDIFSEDYITTTRAIGLSNRIILFNNVLRNAMLPLTTLVILRMGFIIGGSVTIETVFSWPGIGLLIFNAVRQQDYPTLQGTFLVISIAVVLANFIADIVYGYIDPRVRYEK